MKRFVLHFFFIVSIFSFGTNGWAATVVCGNQSGTWNLAGSPYLVECDVNVPSGQVLTVEPGVTILLYDTVSINVYGQMVAVGSQSQHIVFDAVNNNYTWHRIYVEGTVTAPPTSEFKYCDFKNAQTALSLYIKGRIDNNLTTMVTDISNCTFESSVGTAIYGEAYGYNLYQFGTPRRRSAKVNPIVEQCLFDGTNHGIELYIHGSCSTWCASGNSDAIIRNNIFNNLSGTAFSISAMGTDPSLCSGAPVIVNNNFVGGDKGIFVPTPFVAEISNNIFYQNNTALDQAGSSTVGFNDFFDNTIDCVGCSVAFGDPVLTNVNGDPCDMGFNIFMDPLFFGLNDFHLTGSSTCINAGTDVEAPNIDIDGDTRPQGVYYDIGADEYSGSPCSAQFKISPPSGYYGTTQDFDLMLLFQPSEGCSVVDMSATLNGNDITTPLDDCVVSGTLDDIIGGETLRCPAIDDFIDSGSYAIEVILELDDGVTVSDNVKWNILSNTEP